MTMKRIAYFALLGTAICLGGLAATTVSAHAAITTNFKNIKYTDDFYYEKFTNVAYHAKSTKKNIYIWNDTHTKKLYNMKTYPNYTWFKTASGTYKGNKNWIEVSNVVNSKRGWVYQPQLTTGFNKIGYQITKRSYATPAHAGNIFHIPSSSKNLYLWDWTHTKKLVNLKNYTNQNFSQQHSVLMTYKGKSHWYYHTSLMVNGKYTVGYVRGDQTAAGRTTNHKGKNILFPQEFVGTKDYLAYINESKYQKLARAIIKLFPNTPVDLGLSRIAAYNYATNDTWDEDPDEAISTTGYKDIVPFESVATYLMKNKMQTNAQKIAGIKKLLNKAGYTAAKRAKLTDYKLGIYILNNVMGGKSDEAGNLYKGNWYGLVIGKND